VQMMASKIFFTCKISNVSGFDVHFSINMVFILILRGNGHVTCQDKTVYLHPGDFMFFPKDTLFSLESLNDLQIYEIHILPRFFQTLCPDAEDPVFHNFYIGENLSEQRSLEIYHRLASFVFSVAVPNDYEQMSSDNLKSNSTEQIIALGELYLTVRKYFGEYQRHEQHQDDYVHERIVRILDYITRNYTQKITVPQISRELGLNAQYFGSFFFRYFHQSFTDFLNAYRIGNSIEALCHSENNLTQIALDNGFQTYRSYSNAFKKVYSTSPSEYRRIHGGSSRAIHFRESNADSFRFLRKYMDTTSPAPAIIPGSNVRIRLDLQHSPAAAIDNRIHAVSVGSGYQLLQENVYKQLKKAVSECHFSHIHFRDPFCDLLSVYTEPAPNHPMFTWNYVDDIINRILELHLHPYIEIGFMPRELAATKDTLGFGYHPCIGIPKSLSLWADLIRSFLTHCLDQFGPEEMKEWRFDFWNSANIRSNVGFWNGTREEFFDLYLTTYTVFRETAPQLKLGTPNFSIPGGMSWYEDFLNMCRHKGMHPDFLSLHLYSCGDNLPEFEGIFPYTPHSYNYLPLTGTDYIKNTIASLNNLLVSCGFAGLPILAGEWNISYYLLDLVRDTAFMATYIVHTWLQTLQLMDGLTYCSLSDISEQTRPSPLPFPGTQGLLSRDGLTKPAYNALFILHKLDRDILYQDDHCVVTKGKKQWHILVYHMCDYEKKPGQDPSFLSEDYRYHVFNDTNSLEFSGRFALASGTYSITTYQIDREHGCAYDAWLQMGSPDPLTPEITQALIHASYPSLHFSRIQVEDFLHLDITLKPHTVVLYEIRSIS